MWSSPWSSVFRAPSLPAVGPHAAGCCPSGPSRRCSWWCSPGWCRLPPPACLRRRGLLALGETGHICMRTYASPSSHLTLLALTRRAAVLHLADKDAEAMLGPSAYAEAQPAISTLLHCDCMDILAIVAPWGCHVVQWDTAACQGWIALDVPQRSTVSWLQPHRSYHPQVSWWGWLCPWVRKI